jgi:hypothetical protein
LVRNIEIEPPSSRTPQMPACRNGCVKVELRSQASERLRPDRIDAKRRILERMFPLPRMS